MATNNTLASKTRIAMIVPSKQGNFVLTVFSRLGEKYTLTKKKLDAFLRTNRVTNSQGFNGVDYSTTSDGTIYIYGK